MRVFDTFVFDGELELLEHRLRETYELVDAFVLVEAGATYRGTPKPLVFDTHCARFAWAAPKLRHVKLAALGRADLAPRARAAIQRNAIMLALRDLAPDDMVLLLDVDEIPSASLLRRLRQDPPVGPRRLLMTRHYEHLDSLGPASPCCPSPVLPFAAALPRLRPECWDALAERWQGQSGVVVPGRLLLGEPALGLAPGTAFDLRFGTRPAAPPLADAGRHLTSVDGAARLEHKLSRVFHAEWAGARALRPAHLRRCRQYGLHHRGWWYAEVPTGALPPDLQRLKGRYPAMARQAATPPPWRRRMLRSWAWLRLWPAWPEGLVNGVDRHFERLLPALSAPLYAADLGRALWARWSPRRPGGGSGGFSHPGDGEAHVHP